jgi:hypothetical protein
VSFESEAVSNPEFTQYVINEVEIKQENISNSVNLNPTEIFQCDYCGLEFGTRCKISQHFKSHSKPDFSLSVSHFDCWQCDKKFKTLKKMEKHLLTHRTQDGGMKFSNESRNNELIGPVEEQLQTVVNIKQEETVMPSVLFEDTFYTLQDVPGPSRIRTAEATAPKPKRPRSRKSIEINIWKRNSTVKKIPIRTEFRSVLLSFFSLWNFLSIYLFL